LSLGTNAENLYFSKNRKVKPIDRSLVGILGLSSKLKLKDKKMRRFKLWGGVRVPLDEGYFKRDPKNVDVQISSFLKKHYGKGMH